MTPIHISDYWRKFVVKNGNVARSKGCKFHTSRRSLIIDCDEIKKAENRHGPINDFIAFEKADLLYVGLVEFKGKRPDINRAIDQMWSGKGIAEEIIKDSGIKEKTKMYMILVSRSKPASGLLLASMRKQTLKKGILLKTPRCGESFSSIRKHTLVD